MLLTIWHSSKKGGGRNRHVSIGMCLHFARCSVILAKPKLALSTSNARFQTLLTQASTSRVELSIMGCFDRSESRCQRQETRSSLHTYIEAEVNYFSSTAQVNMRVYILMKDNNRNFDFCHIFKTNRNLTKLFQLIDT